MQQRKSEFTDNSNLGSQVETKAGRPVHIYTWNPPFDQFNQLPLDEKFELFKKFVMTSQEHFLHRAVIFPNETCLLIAPDLIFSPFLDDSVHTLVEKIKIDEEMQRLSSYLSPRTLVIAGSMEYLCEDTSQYAITSHIVTCDGVKTYDKKHSVCAAGRQLTNPIQTHVSMRSGKDSGCFSFQGFNLGLEICQDHERAALKSELGYEQYVDIHVLLTAGQSIVKEHICTPLATIGLMIQVELKLNYTYKAGVLGEKELETAIYQVGKSTPASGNFRIGYFNQLGKKCHVKLEKSANPIDLGNDVTLTQQIVCPHKLRLSTEEKVLEKLWCLLQLPQWKNLTTTFTTLIFGRNEKTMPPEGIIELKKYFERYYRGEFTQTQLLSFIGVYADKKLKEWAVTRDETVKSLYIALSVLKEQPTCKTLSSLLKALDEVATELNAASPASLSEAKVSFGSKAS